MLVKTARMLCNSKQYYICVARRRQTRCMHGCQTGAALRCPGQEASLNNIYLLHVAFATLLGCTQQSNEHDCQSTIRSHFLYSQGHGNCYLGHASLQTKMKLTKYAHTVRLIALCSLLWRAEPLPWKCVSRPLSHRKRASIRSPAWARSLSVFPVLSTMPATLTSLQSGSTAACMSVSRHATHTTQKTS